MVLDDLKYVQDPIPAEVRANRKLLDLGAALELIHRPQREGEEIPARDTLRFHEAFLLQLALLERRAAARSTPGTRRVAEPGGLLERFDAALPFALTGDQTAVGHEIAADLAAESPMTRLVQGEVGSGKTLVALRAMLRVVDSGGQAALLAPTEVLPCSTGVIGWRLPVDAMLPALPAAVATLQGASVLPAARGIMTTDLYPKVRRAALGD